MATAGVLAKQWDKTLETEKVIQELAAQGKSITTKYVYKRQRAPFEDLDEIEKAGEQANFLRWLNEEIDRMIVNTIVMAILVGDSVNALANRVTTFESIGKKTVTDVFTKVTHPTVALTVTVEDIRTMCDEVKNPNGRRKVLVLSQTLLTALSKFLMLLVVQLLTNQKKRWQERLALMKSTLLMFWNLKLAYTLSVSFLKAIGTTRRKLLT